MNKFLTGLVVFLSIAGYIGASQSGDPPGVGDSIFIRKTLWPETEKDELVISRNGQLTSIYTMYTADGSSLEFLFSNGNNTDGYDCLRAYNAAADGDIFLFYKRPGNHLYATYGTYQEYDPVPGSVDFVKNELLLISKHSTHLPADTLDIGDQTGYFVNQCAMLRVGFALLHVVPSQ